MRHTSPSHRSLLFLMVLSISSCPVRSILLLFGRGRDRRIWRAPSTYATLTKISRTLVHTIQYNTIQYNSMLYSMLQYATLCHVDFLYNWSLRYSSYSAPCMLAYKVSNLQNSCSCRYVFDWLTYSTFCTKAMPRPYNRHVRLYSRFSGSCQKICDIEPCWAETKIV